MNISVVLSAIVVLGGALGFVQLVNEAHDPKKKAEESGTRRRSRAKRMTGRTLSKVSRIWDSWN